MLLIPILAVSLLIVIIYIAGRLTNVIDPPQDMMHAGVEMVWRHLPHRYVYWDHCDRCYGRWESTEIPESAVEVNDDRDECDVCGYPECEPDCDCECHTADEFLADIKAEPFGPVTFEVAYNTLRLSQPHLFRDDWYQQSRMKFSRWAADEWEKIDRDEREMGIGAYAA